MSQPNNDQQQPENVSGNEKQSYNHDDVARYYKANLDIESNRHYIEKTREQRTGTE